jgi:bacteriocin-like protein
MDNPNEKKLEKELSEKELEKVSGGISSASTGGGGGKAILVDPTVLDMDASSPKLY